MLLIHCPYCEKDLPELEFRHAGEAHIARPTDWNKVSDEDFEKFFFIRENHKGVVFERWRHVHGCGRFFNAARNSVSDKFIRTYKAGEPKPELTESEIAAAAPKGKGTPANEPVVATAGKGGAA
jgi:sarcosine oxidase subunit delta